MASHTKKDKKIKVEKFKKNDLYHDVKPEKKEKLGRKEFEAELLKLEVELQGREASLKQLPDV
jgi:hypothetical protein